MSVFFSRFSKRDLREMYPQWTSEILISLESHTESKSLNQSRVCLGAGFIQLYLLPPMLPCGQPFRSGEPWKAGFPWPCCIIGDCVWAMRGESRGLCGVPGPPKPPSACWLIPVVDASRQVNQTGPQRLDYKPMY